MKSNLISLTGSERDIFKIMISAFAILATVSLGSAAWMLRFEPLSGQGSYIKVWDRWDHRFCVMGAIIGKPVCSLKTVPSMRSASNGAEQIVQAVKQEGLSLNSNLAPQVRTRGFTDGEIALYFYSLRDEMLMAGAPQSKVDKFLQPYISALSTQ